MRHYISMIRHSFILQALRSRDSLQLEYTDCLLDKNRLRKRNAELQVSLEQQTRLPEKEREGGRQQGAKTGPCLHCVSQGGGACIV